MTFICAPRSKVKTAWKQKSSMWLYFPCNHFGHTVNHSPLEEKCFTTKFLTYNKPTANAKGLARTFLL